MRRGTTPTLEFELEGVDLEEVQTAILTIRQKYKNIINQELTIDTDASVLYLTLTQQQTLMFEEGKCQIQIKVLFKDGSVGATVIKNSTVEEIFNEEVL